MCEFCLQVRRQGKEDGEKLSEALPTIRKQAAGEFAEPHDRAQEPLRNSFNRNDDQPRSRGRGRSFGRERRSAQEDADILPVMPEVSPAAVNVMHNISASVLANLQYLEDHILQVMVM